MKQQIISTRDVARELARKYSTMTHEELDALEQILVPMNFQKGKKILLVAMFCAVIKTAEFIFTIVWNYYILSREIAIL